MKPCNETEIVGLKSMGRSKDYYAGYDAAVKNNIIMLDKIRAEIRKKMRFDSFNEGIVSYDDVSKILDKYITKSKE